MKYEYWVGYTDVLILYHESDEDNGDKPAVITDASGRDDQSIDFEFEENTEVDNSCGVKWRNEMYIFGGKRKTKQVSQIVGCQLKNIGELKFKHISGGCASVTDSAIYLCFGSDNEFNGSYKRCRVLESPTGNYDYAPLSRYYHRSTRIAASRGELLKIFHLAKF